MGSYDKTVGMGSRPTLECISFTGRMIGTLLVGIFFNTFLYGVVTYQFGAYYRTKFNDPALTKYMVLFLFVLDTFHSASAIYMAWDYTVTEHDNPAALAVTGWPYVLTPLGSALAALVTQMYLGHRLRRLTGSKFLYGMIILLAIPTFILGTVCSVEVAIIQVWASLPRITPLAIAWVSMQVVLDTIITVSLVIVFYRSRTGFRKMDTLLNRLIRCAIQTGVFGSIFALGVLITFIVLPHTSLYAMLSIPIGRIYTNTLLDTLLTRELLVVEQDEAGNVTQSIVIDSVYWPAYDIQGIQSVRSPDIQKSYSAHISEAQVVRQPPLEIASGLVPHHDLGPC